MKPIDWTAIFNEHKGKWVALKQDERTIVAASVDATIAFKKARRSGVKVPILLKVPIMSMPYVGHNVKV